MRGWALLIGALSGFGVGAGCLLQLDHEVACGDGYVDPQSEECDPGVPSSYVHACGNTMRPLGRAACDPETCTLLDDVAHCGVCGDGYVDGALHEDCDPNSSAPLMCPYAPGDPHCDPQTCTLAGCPCGDGVLDPATEECDPGIDPGQLATPRLCAGTSDYPPLVSPYGDAAPYFRGTSIGCTKSCRWDRTHCDYCQNGQLDKNLLIDDENHHATEECDGTVFDPEVLAQRFPPDCSNADTDLQAAAICTSDCRIIAPSEPNSPLCCRKKDTEVLPDAPGAPCCYALAHPGETPYTSRQDNTGKITQVCK